MPTLPIFARTVDKIVSRWADGREDRSFSPLEQPARSLFGDGMGRTGDIAGALLDLHRAGPLVAEVLRTHPSLSAKDPSRTFGTLFGEEDREWAGVQAPFAFTGMMTAAMIVLTDVGMPKQVADLAMRIGFGLDPFNGLLRDRLLGVFGGLRDPLKLGIKLPARLHTFESLFDQTCLLGIKDALNNVAGASAALPRESTTAVITLIRPNRGCVGTVVEITGHGFGATQPADLDLCFTGLNGGVLVATVPAADWADTHIRVAAPAGVGDGPVSFIHRGSTSYAGDTITSATEQLAGAMESCLGMGASRVAFGLRQIATKLGAPLIDGTGNNRFGGGPPKITSFTGNMSTIALLRPRGPLVVAWSTVNADSVEITAAGPRDLPVISGPLAGDGDVRFPSVAGTSAWRGTYTLTAKNTCGTATATLSVEMTERLALALSGGGSTGAFEVGAVRCLTDVFNYRPDIICGTSVGAFNAAKLAEGPAALPQLEAVWLGMVSSDDLYTPTGWVVSIVQNLASLGVKGIGNVNFAAVLGVHGSSYNFLSPNVQIAIGVAKNVLGNVADTWAFSVSDIIFNALKAGLHFGKVIDGLRGLLRSRSLFNFTPLRLKIDAAIDPVKVKNSGILLRIAMVNLDDGQARYVDQRGRFVHDDYPVPLLDAIQASASMPVAYPPTLLPVGYAVPTVSPTGPPPTGTFVDGGVRDGAPLRAADEAGASSILAILSFPATMDEGSYTAAPLPALAMRSVESLFDEILQNDLAPFRGYNVPIKIIAPQFALHSLFSVDQGLIRMNMDYGYMRAFDEMQADDAKRAEFRRLSADITALRMEIWGPDEHRSEGFLMEEEKVSFAAVGLKRTASSDYLLEVRRAKKAVRALFLARQTLAKSAAANPPGIERVWQKWELHDWSATLVTPWQASYAHIGPAVPAETAPGPLPPP